MSRFLKLAAAAVLGVIPAGALDVVTTTLPAAIVHRPYGPDPIQVSGGGRCTYNHVSFRVIQGRLPDGMTLSPGGYLSGIPRQTGNFPFMVRIGNECEVIGKSFALRVEGAPILEVSPASLEFHHRIGAANPDPAQILVASSWRDLPYWIEAAGADWIAIQPLLGRTPPDGHALHADPVRIGVDPTKLKPGVYRTSIRIVAWQAANEVRIPVTVTVTAP
jgi:hypothetical protein